MKTLNKLKQFITGMFSSKSDMVWTHPSKNADKQSALWILYINLMVMIREQATDFRNITKNSPKVPQTLSEVNSQYINQISLTDIHSVEEPIIKSKETIHLLEFEISKTKAELDDLTHTDLDDDGKEALKGYLKTKFDTKLSIEAIEGIPQIINGMVWQNKRLKAEEVLNNSSISNLISHNKLETIKNFNINTKLQQVVRYYWLDRIEKDKENTVLYADKLIADLNAIAPEAELKISRDASSFSYEAPTIELNENTEILEEKNSTPLKNKDKEQIICSPVFNEFFEIELYPKFTEDIKTTLYRETNVLKEAGIFSLVKYGIALLCSIATEYLIALSIFINAMGLPPSEAHIAAGYALVSVTAIEIIISTLLLKKIFKNVTL